jgi:hypothetical protein
MKILTLLSLLIVLTFYPSHSHFAFANDQFDSRPWIQSDDDGFFKWFTLNEELRKDYISQECPYKSLSHECIDLIHRARIIYSYESNISVESFSPSKKFGILLQKMFPQYSKIYNKYFPPNTTQKPDIDFNMSSIQLYDMLKITRILNLTPQSTEMINNEIDFNHYDKGFMVQKYFRYALGLGAKGVFNFPNVAGLQSLVNFSIGLMPTLEKTTLFKYYVQNKEDISKIKRQIPHKAKNLNHWIAGDNVFYESTGGAVFIASAGIPFLSVGTTIALEGSWRYYIEKGDGKKIFISVSKVTTKSALAFVGTAVSSLGEKFLKDDGIGFSYEIDLSNESAAMALEDLIKGNFIPIQKMAKDDSNFFVQDIESQNYQLTGKVKIFNLGLPFINLTASSGHYFSHSNIHLLESGLKIENEYGIFSQEIIGKTFSRHKNRIKSFYGGVTKITDSNNKLISIDNKIQFNWYFEKDHFKNNSFNRAIEQIIQDTSLENLRLKSFETEKFGYAQINFKTETDAHFTNAITGANKKNIFANIQKNMQTYINSYFEGKDTYDLCNLLDKFRSCKNHYREESLSALSEIMEMTTDLKYQLGIDNLAFAKSYAKIGKLAWSNPFIFKAVFEQMKKCGSTLLYEVSGEKISHYRLKQVTPLDPLLCN